MHARSLVYLAARARVALALAPQSGHNSAHDTRSRGILRSLEPLGARGPNDFASDGHGGVYCRSEEHTSELQSRLHLVCRLLLEKKKKQIAQPITLLSATSSQTAP